MESFCINSKINQGDYVRLVLNLTYRKPIMLIVLLVGFVMFSLSAMHFLGLYSAGTQADPYVQLFVGFLIAFILPFSVVRNARKNYDTNERLKEHITYCFDSDSMTITGESFSSRLDWEKTYKIVGRAKWILIYQNKIVANVIPTESFTDEEMIKFKSIISEQNTIKNNFD